MNFRRLLVLTALVVTATAGSPIFGQNRRPPSSLRQRCEPEAPLTRLEDLENHVQTIVVRGSTHITTLATRDGTARVDALEVRDEGDGSSTTGVAITLKNSGDQDISSRAYIDYEEIDRVIKAWDRVARTDDTITKLNNFESSYRTKGDLEISVFRQTPGGLVAASISGGLCNRVRIYLSLDELIKLRHMIVQAKERLDELK